MSLWRTILLAIKLVGARFGGAGIALASQVVLAHLLPQAEVGVVFLGMSAAAFLSLIISVGYPQLAITTLPRYYTLGRERLLDAYHNAFWRDSLWMTAATFLAAIAIYFWAPFNSGIKTALLFGCLSAVPSAFIRMNSSIANALRRYTLSYVPDFLYRPGLLLLFLIAVWLLKVQVSVNQVLMVFVLANTVVAIAQAMLLGKEGTIRGLLHPVRRKLAPLLRGRALALVVVGTVAYGFSDIVTLIAGFFLTTDQVAIVGVTVRLAALAGFITQAAQQFVIPDLTDAMARGTASDVHALLRRINIVALGASLAAIGGAALLGPLVLRVYGVEYIAGHWPLVLFMVSQMFRAAGGMNQHLLSLGGHQINTASACIFSLMTLVGMTAILAPIYGVIGLAAATVISEAMWTVLLALQAQRLTGRRGDFLALIKSVGA